MTRNTIKTIMLSTLHGLACACHISIPESELEQIACGLKDCPAADFPVQYGFSQQQIGFSMRMRQMGFSQRLKAHKKVLTLETLKFIVEYLKDGDARMAALRSGVPESHASRQGSWLKKHPMVLAALETELDDRDRLKLEKSLAEIDRQMEACKELLGLQDY